MMNPKREPHHKIYGMRVDAAERQDPHYSAARECAEAGHSLRLRASALRRGT